jgi:hypothetical protein
LKWLHQPDLRSASWEITIRTHRRLIAEHLEESPGLKAKREELFAKAYFEAVATAALETGLAVDVFPAVAPFALEKVMDEAFWPEPAAD